MSESIGSKVYGIMSMPRLGFTDNLFCAASAMTSLQVNIDRMSGVFWSQSLTEMIERHLDIEYILTIDYDSVFKTEDVMSLFLTMETNKNIDALCALQMRRDGDVPLCCLRTETGEPAVVVNRSAFSNSIIPIVAGHFGLTMLRTSAFTDLPKPWFQAIPDKNGGWGEGRTDSDVAFWAKWIDAGKTIFLSPQVRIGHLQLMITWPDQNLNAVVQYVGDYNKYGKPHRTEGYNV